MMKPEILFRLLAGNLPGGLLGLAVLPLAALGQANYATPHTFTTVAGSTGYGSADGTGTTARFAFPCSAAVDMAGNLYVADTVNSTIRKMTLDGTNWVVTTLAGLPGGTGTNDGTGSAARFYYPNGVAVDSGGNVYVADSGNHTIREVTPVGTNWVVTTLAGRAGYSGYVNATGSNARFYLPFGLTVAKNGNVYVADEGNNTIREMTPVGTNWVVTTLATGFNWPCGVAVDRAANVYVADTDNHAIRKVTSGGVVTTLAGFVSYSSWGTNDGTGSTARFYGPADMAVDTNGNVYVSENGNNTIRKVTPSGVVTTLAGLAGHAGSANGTNSAARFNGPYGVAVDSAGNVYVADGNNDTIRKVTPVGTNWVVTTLAGLAGSAGSADGTNSAARFNGPVHVAVDSAGNLYVADYLNDTIRKVMPVGTNWVVTTLAGWPGVSGSADGTGSAARFYGPEGVAVDTNGNVYVADQVNCTIRKVTPVGTNWVVTTLAGLAGSIGSVDGTNRAARFAYPVGMAVDMAGNVYVAENGDYTIRQVTPVGTNWVVTTLAGLAGYIADIDGTGSAARFNEPFGLAVDMAGNLYVADSGNSTIRKGFPASSVPPPMLQPPNLSAGQFGFGITGLPGLAVNIESSGDLSAWQVVGTCTLEDGTNSFVNPSPSQSAQFYRAQVR